MQVSVGMKNCASYLMSADPIFIGVELSHADKTMSILKRQTGVIRIDASAGRDIRDYWDL